MSDEDRFRAPGPPRPGRHAVGPGDMAESARRASNLLKALANPDRLVILCHLAEGERTVTELGRLVRLRQPTLSQQLARLRADGLVQTRREGKMIHYALASHKASRVIELLYDLYCAPSAAEAGARPSAGGAAPDHAPADAAED